MHAWDAVLALERTELLTIGAASTPPLVWMSPVLRAQIRAATPEGLSGRAVNAAAEALVEGWPDEPRSGLAAHLRSCATSLQRAGGERLWASGAPHPLLLRTGRSIDSARLTAPAVSYWRELARASEKIFGPDHPHTLAIGSHLAQALLTAGHAAEAVEWAR